MQVNKQQLESGIKQLTGFKLGKEYMKAVHFHPDYLIISSKMLGWMNPKLESRLP